MRPEDIQFLFETYQDCLDLKERGELTEFGEGELYLCEIVLQEDLENLKFEQAKQHPDQTTLEKYCV